MATPAIDNGPMVRSGVAVVTGAALLLAMVFVPFTHLHANGNEHHHLDELTSDHRGLVHSHLAAHQTPRSSPESPGSPDRADGDNGERGDTDGTRWDRPVGSQVTSLDTMSTELAWSGPVSAALEVAHVPPPPDPVAELSRPSVPRAHGPPFGSHVHGRAPPA